MNLIKIKKYTLHLVLLAGVALSQMSCYTQDEVVPGLLTSMGRTANIALMWTGPVRTTATSQPPTTITVNPGTTVAVTIEYISEEPIKEFNLYSRPGTTGTFVPLTKVANEVAKPTYNADLRNMVAVFNVTAPSTAKATLQIAGDITTSNGLISNQKTITIRTN